jgi:hypothetical protein
MKLRDSRKQKAIVKAVREGDEKQKQRLFCKGGRSSIAFGFFHRFSSFDGSADEPRRSWRDAAKADRTENR